MGHPADLSECSRPKGRAVALGVDVGADGMTAVVSDGRGRVVRSLERPVPEDCRSDGRRLAEEIGFAAVMSGPMVRSSYRAGMLWGRAMVKRGRPIPERLAQLAEPATARQEASALLGTHPHLAAAC